MTRPQAAPRLAAGALALAAVGLVPAPAAPAPPAGPWLLVVSGVAGDEEHRTRFVELSRRLLEAAVVQHRVPEDRVRYLAERTDLAPELVHARSTRDNVGQAIRWIAEGAAAGEPVLIVLIGHGSAQGQEARFNLPGPDMGPGDFAPLLGLLSAQSVAFVNTTSASGGFLPDLSAPGRVVVTATRGPFEREDTRFPEFFVDAWDGGAADTDKDGRVSVLEAFVYAATEVRRAYEAEGRLLTEHALLDDDGDGEGSEAADLEETDGAVARYVALGGLSATGRDGTIDPELAKLLTDRERLQAQLDGLRARREQMSEEDYLDRLEELLVQIAQLDAEIRARGGEGT